MTACVAFEKVNEGAFLGQTANRVEARARAMERALSDLLLTYARGLIAEEIKDLESAGALTKAGPADSSKTELAIGNLLRMFGLRQMRDAARRSAGTVGADPDKIVIAPGLVDDFLRDKEVKLQFIVEETRSQVRASVRNLIRDSLREVPTPSAGEIARRIRSQAHGPGWIPEQPSDEAPFMGTRMSQTDTGTLYAFSSERAALISRTELVQAENSGIMAGYQATGVEEIMWLAYRDGRSGDRKHNLMHKETTEIGTPFIMPDGASMRFPGDPQGPIRHLANCRCTVAPVIRRFKR